MVTFVGVLVRGHSRIDNLSLGSAAIASGASVTRGEYLWLTITLPAQPATIDVELAPVRWVNNHSLGVEFIRMSPTSSQILQHYIEHLGVTPKELASATS